MDFVELDRFGLLLIFFFLVFVSFGLLLIFFLVFVLKASIFNVLDEALDQLLVDQVWWRCIFISLFSFYFLYMPYVFLETASALVTYYVFLTCSHALKVLSILFFCYNIFVVEQFSTILKIFVCTFWTSKITFLLSPVFVQWNKFKPNSFTRPNFTIIF